MSNTNANLPNPTTPVILPDGRMSPQWFAFFLAVFNRTGGPGSPIDINTLQMQDEISQEVPPQNPATQDALRGVAELWAEQRPAVSLDPIYRRLDEIDGRMLDQPPQVSPSAATPVMDGAASLGADSRFARGDHVHPSDTTRAALAGAAFTGNVSAPLFVTTSGTVTGAASGAAKTVYTLPNAAPAAYLVSVNIGANGDATNYGAFAVVVTNLAAARIALSNNGSLQTITLSGLNVQSTQSSGGSQTIGYTITRIG